MTRTITVDHLARVEGHGGITVQLDGDEITLVRFDIFEGSRLIETLVRGRRFEDVAGIVSRICSICSASHALTSLRATENAFGIQVSPQTELLRELMHCGEYIESHALHLFLLATPDYLNYPSAIAMGADRPELLKLGLRLKKLGNSIQETIGGRAIHPVNAVPGGFAALPSVDQWIALRRDLQQGVADVETALETLSAVPPLTEFCRADMAFAAMRDGQIVVRSNGTEETIAPADYRSLTNEREVPFSNAKHSLYRGRPFTVGALARVTLNPAGLSDNGVRAMQQLGLSVPSDNPFDTFKAQAVELASSVECASVAVQRVLADEALKQEPRVTIRPRSGVGTAVTEAPRGLLVHSYTYDADGCITSADMITPTAMNAASIESHFRSIVMAGAGDGTDVLTKKLEMLARAYDPCISCSVHLVQTRNAV
jgi:sulfhydrogenase subunit alpha